MAGYGFMRTNTVEALHVPLQMPARLALETGQLARSTTSQLAVLTDEEYEEGIRQLKRDMADSEAQHETLTIEADLRLYATTAWVP